MVVGGTPPSFVHPTGGRLGLVSGARRPRRFERPAEGGGGLSFAHPTKALVGSVAWLRRARRARRWAAAAALAKRPRCAHPTEASGARLQGASEPKTCLRLVVTALLWAAIWLLRPWPHRWP